MIFFDFCIKSFFSLLKIRSLYLFIYDFCAPLLMDAVNLVMPCFEISLKKYVDAYLRLGSVRSRRAPKALELPRGASITLEK